MQNLINQFALYSFTPYVEFIRDVVPYMWLVVMYANFLGWFRFFSSDLYKSIKGCRLLFFTHAALTVIEVFKLQEDTESTRFFLYYFFGATFCFGLIYLFADKAIERFKLAEQNQTTED